MKKIAFFVFSSIFLLAQTPEKSPFIDEEIKAEQNPFKEEQMEQIEEKMENPLIFLDAIQGSFFNSHEKMKNSLFIQYKKGEIYKIRTRYAMVTSINFQNDYLVKFVNGDSIGFEIKAIKDEFDNIKTLIIKPQKIGIDTNLIAFGKSGQIYSFYLFSTHFTNSKNPTLVVFVENMDSKKINEKQKKLEMLKEKNKKLKQKEKEEKSIDYTAFEREDENFISIGDSVNKIHIEKSKIQEGFYQKARSYRTWWSFWIYKKESKEAKALKALRIFKDKDYTYFKYDRADNASKFPVIYKVVDGYDHPINTKIVGNYIIAEDVGDKFTLRLGKEYVCVRFRE
ncbi:TrbG/VirB9 family P-type conjugative transfer protein [Helicobacter anatolicus]|uniref:TrbG/VirB9 family P-type conjugative transfer protein n=1 Tax=Helicobacter anatolicus TaxID=2905874 RepID=UPI001E45ED71|nr:TrbG/VirB9 family P-type conjugative transfer protein [Helicobacter anatolicus]MCE3040025.1 TrbG/VirB9 family P-type conjugative transfer protein [Helicobacter anatolicus]